MVKGSISLFFPEKHRLYPEQILSYCLSMNNTRKESKKVSGKIDKVNRSEIISERLVHGTIIETVLDQGQTKFVIYRGGESYEAMEEKLACGRTIVPMSPNNPLIKCGLVKLPSKPEGYGTTSQLVTEVRNFIHCYVDLSDDFEIAATYYVLLSWIYDDFNEIPYLRKVGDFGSGKTRFLKVLGAICNRAITASGGTSTAALFHIIDKFNGTLILDEADYHFSDERSDVAKILNNGNAKGFPILRVSVDSNGKYSPVSYNVFCPKIIASRSNYQDQALESRFITEQFKPTDIRADIPISLPESLKKKHLLYATNYFRIDSPIWERLNPIKFHQATALKIGSIRYLRRYFLSLPILNIEKFCLD